MKTQATLLPPCLIAYFLFFISFEIFAASLSTGVAAIINIQGQGDHRPQAEMPWLPAKVSQNLTAGAFVRTGQLSKMGILFSDETQIRINQNSLLQIKEVGQSTRLRLDSGRAWSQTKRAPGSSLYFDTPAATAAIRGTDWDIEVDEKGATLLTVFSGVVDFYNDLGTVTLNRNEAALAEPGKAPVRLVLSNPKDRIQWVNALTVDPRRHLGALVQDPEWRPVVDAVYSGDLKKAETALAGSSQRGSVPHVLLASDLALVNGDSTLSLTLLNDGLQAFPNEPRFLAAKARVLMLVDRLNDSQLTLMALAGNESADIWVSKGDLLRRMGDAEGALLAYKAALALRSDEDRAVAGSGAIFNEREFTHPARMDLGKAIALRPDIASYKGELGTLETFSNQFDDAERAFAESLAVNPSDYVALTGLGLLRLKQGRRQEALDSFLRAGLMAPNYARAKTYTGVVYYQMGRNQDAISTLLQVRDLDDKDPIPYIFLSQIYTDIFEPELAVQASRDAVERMPYLKSANQLANDQKGNSNLGSALAFFGLEEWALELAQQSAYPYWGGSHLFLSDRYNGEFNKNSELFQGFLTDPLSFGASPTFSSLLREPGHYGVLGIQRKEDLIEGYISSVTANGLSSEGMPSAYFFKYNLGKGEFPFRNFVANNPPGMQGLTVSDLGLDVWTLGVGLQPTSEMGVFLYYNRFQTTFIDKNAIQILGEPEGSTSVRPVQDQFSLGTSYKWTPTSQTSFKYGHNDTTFDTYRFPIGFTLPGAVDGEPADLFFGLGINQFIRRKIQDYQVAHTFDYSTHTRLQFASTYVREGRRGSSLGSGSLFAVNPSQVEFLDTVGFANFDRGSKEFASLSMGVKHDLTDRIKLDLTWVLNRLQQNVNSDAALIYLDTVDESPSYLNVRTNQLTPRFGLVYRPDSRWILRAAYQDWIRPLNIDTLQSVETAGIPLEDRLVQSGGRSKRNVFQASYVPDNRTFWFGRIEKQSIVNPIPLSSDIGTPSVPFLEFLRSTQLANLSIRSAVDFVPNFEQGDFKLGTFGVNRILNANWSAYGKYVRTSSNASFKPSGVTSSPEGQRITGLEIPNLPEDTAVFGATWASQSRFYLSSRLLYRGDSFADMSNSRISEKSWSADLAGFWETRDKSWIVGASVLNFGLKKSDRENVQYVVDVRYRF